MKTTKSIDPNSLAVPDLHKLLLSAVAPRPIALASTVNAKGEVNLSPFSFFNVFSANPPILIFSPARRGRDNTTKHTYENVKYNHEVVINIVNHDIVEQMSLSSTEYDSGVNEFIKAGFTQVPSETIKPPRVGEAPISFECTIDQIVELGAEGGAGNLVISRINRIHVHTKYLKDSGELDTQKLDLVARMGESWYCRASGDALFEIPKPIFTKGIGVDKLPGHILESTVLTGNHLGRLGNMESIPNSQAIEKEKKELQDILNIEDKIEQREALHQQVVAAIGNNEVKKALNILFCLN
ncbi:MAG: flavin reductase family protein [Flavobacteriaceae bacterium]